MQLLRYSPRNARFYGRDRHFGNVITKYGVKPNSEMVDSIANFPQTKNQIDIKSFRGLQGIIDDLCEVSRRIEMNCHFNPYYN